MTSGTDLITQERQRQLEGGRTVESDRRYVSLELWDAARCYMAASRFAELFHTPMPRHNRDLEGFWPWPEASWNPSVDPVRNLVKAGQLIAAEIDRLQAERSEEWCSFSRRPSTDAPPYF